MMGVGYWRYKRFHVSYLLGWLALGVLIGLLFSKIWQFNFGLHGLLVAAALSIAALKSRRWWTVR